MTARRWEIPTSTTDPVLPGTYKNFTSLVGVSFGYRFGR